MHLYRLEIHYKSPVSYENSFMKIQCTYLTIEGIWWLEIGPGCLRPWHISTRVGRIELTHVVPVAVNTSILNKSPEYAQLTSFPAVVRDSKNWIYKARVFHSPQHDSSAACFVNDSRLYLRRQRLYIQLYSHFAIHDQW